ncbi:bifunctional diaminohydroxyphosphoribosylaminopyrimidine deaminase/5-amino-6-(5-phosphoribosylamino)uracil reductase RibD [Staphylococcus sp. 17KM0847]|uniref:bifunctional diaminohydroxyphosphoribosylaminopyrimidine deaminase/5-amino-6-(5-phosphoribosylamino)uracil reductase RibD n=1 Tax=Staphylococcus sp. 17KM0847 TaxID=2583989 RepID=UPI0015DD3D36|nr:bifunctional diaminohydroxyphosphoribosylaminopyrimidine deaminase/5-amino-6-(5-phosphoribosylamino)uracil reductase RibD [Staphylococcus sp. 17KM0847]QLK86304.1 bifunctional diaminohydroxyphosphoribosylaminopyrimidine deaminase/5-amino-6-(5-phosphoribosylamino)uracil reductase RibD [Staphylococcus sp. 17KM0847]
MNNYIDYAVQLAEMVEGQTGVNPPVGAVIVKEGHIIGIGAHLKKGDKHAEIQAIDMAGAEQVNGATMYVSLEPCSHYGATPPCAQRIIDTGVAKVVYAAKDITLHSTGHEMMTRAGIDVAYVPHSRALRLYEPFFESKTEAVPIVTVKVSASIDGKQATDDRESQWITSKAVKSDVFRLRHMHDVILTGNGTLSTDNPSLTVRSFDGRQPARAILTDSGQVNWEATLFHDHLAPVYIYTSNPNLVAPYAHVHVVHMPDTEVGTVLQDLYKKGFGRVLVEAGPRLTSQFLASHYTTNFILYLAPKIIGGQGKYQYYQTDWTTPLDQLMNFEIVHSERIDTDMKLLMKRK